MYVSLLMQDEGKTVQSLLRGLCSNLYMNQNYYFFSLEVVVTAVSL